VLGVLIAGTVNPVGFFSHLVWGIEEFDVEVWALNVAVALTLGCMAAQSFFRDGGYGITAVALITAFCILAACAITGPVYAFVTWAFQQFDISLGLLGFAPVYDMTMAIAVSDAYMRISLFFASIAIPAAVILLRLISLKRLPTKLRAKT
jgi:hypothetical protein